MDTIMTKISSTSISNPPVTGENSFWIGTAIAAILLAILMLVLIFARKRES